MELARGERKQELGATQIPRAYSTATSFLLPPASTSSSDARCCGIQTMTAGQEPPTADKPYRWDETVQLPKETLRLFQEVASGIDKSQTGERSLVFFGSRHLCRICTRSCVESSCECFMNKLVPSWTRGTGTRTTRLRNALHALEYALIRL